MILIFHLSKYFLKNLNFFFKINYTRRLPWNLRRLSVAIFVKMSSVFLFGHKELTVISQDFWVTFAFDSSLGILLQSK